MEPMSNSNSSKRMMIRPAERLLHVRLLAAHSAILLASRQYLFVSSYFHRKRRRGGGLPAHVNFAENVTFK